MDNRLWYIDDTAFQGVNLTNLRLSGNQLTHKSIEHVQFPATLEKLSLYDNPIASIDGVRFPSSLTELDLSNTQITSIASDTFSNLANLTKLNLWDTQLTRLPLALASLIQLEKLSISSPNLTCSCSESSLASWYHDRTVDLDLQRKNGGRLYNYLYFDVSGKCDNTDIYYFLANLAPQCPSS